MRTQRPWLGAGGTVAWVLASVLCRSPWVSGAEPKPVVEAGLRELIDNLASPDADVRVNAARTLARYGPAGLKALPHLAAALGDPEATVRRQVAETLGILRPPPKVALPLLEETLADRDRHVRHRAVYWFPRYAPLPDAWLALLAQRLKDPAENVRRAAVDVLGTLGRTDLRALDLLAKAVADVTVRQQVPDAIARARTHREKRLALLFGLFGHADPDVRRWTALQFSKFAPLTRAEVARVAKGLTDPSPGVQRWLCGHFAYLGPHRTLGVPALIRCVEQDGDAAGSAAECLGRMGTEANAAVAALRRALKSANGNTRGKAAEALGSIGPTAKGAIPDLVALLADANPEARRRAAFALGDLAEFAKGAAPAVHERLNDTDHRVVCAACYALFRIGGEADPLVPLLEKRIQARSVDVRRVAAYVLAEMGPKAGTAVPTLTEALSTTNWFGWWPAAVALGKMGRHAAAAAPAIRQRLLKHPDDVIANAVLAAIEGRLEERLPPIVKALSHENTYVRQAAAGALGEIGPRAAAALPALDKLANDTGGKTRLMALQAIAKIKGDKPLTRLDEATRMRR